MKFASADLDEALTEWHSHLEHELRAGADNIVFEERVGERRRASFESFAADARGGMALRRRQTDYYVEHVAVADGMMPHTFLRELDAADLGRIDEEQPIVRLENIQRVLDKMGVDFETLREAKARDDEPLIDKFLATWNGALRDARPAFAAFRDQLIEDLEAEDWPCRLRDRLGLAHYDCADGPVPVALMAYKVREVLAANPDDKAACAFTVPTVLDSKPWPFFFPAPPSLRYGRAMPLVPIDSDELLLAEMLHCRLTYRRHHLVGLGLVDRGVGDLDVRDLRNHHLLALRLASGEDNFGEEIP